MQNYMTSKLRIDKFHRILFYFCWYTIQLLLTEISDHTGNICSDIQGAWTSLRSVHTS